MRKYVTIILVASQALAAPILAQEVIDEEMDDIMSNIRSMLEVSDRQQMFDEMMLCAKIAEIGADSIGQKNYRTYTDVAESIETLLGSGYVENETVYLSMSYVHTAVEKAFQDITDVGRGQAEVEAFRMVFDYCQSLSNF
jgi:hypothetical protein